MVLAAVLRLGIGDVREVAVAGDSESDMLCGSRAGASVVAGVITGVHSRERLIKGGATHILDSIADLPALLLGSVRVETPVGASEELRAVLSGEPPCPESRRPEIRPLYLRSVRSV